MIAARAHSDLGTSFHQVLENAEKYASVQMGQLGICPNKLLIKPLLFYRLYLPSMLVTLIDTFTSTIFPSAYYEEFYIYFYILQ